MHASLEKSSSMSYTVTEDMLTEQRSPLFALDKELTDYRVFLIFWEIQLDSYWTHKEIDWERDRASVQADPDSDELYFIRRLLAFFAFADNLVVNNLADNFISEIKVITVKHCLTVQAAMETIHSRVYRDALNVYVTNEKERLDLALSYENEPVLVRKRKWLEKYMNPSKPFRERILAFVAAEGIFFSSAFCAIFWLKKRGIMPGLTFSNELINRDEGLHTLVGVHIEARLNERCQENVKEEIMRTACELEMDFVENCFRCDLIGMNSVSMKAYVKHTGNTVYDLVSSGGRKLYPGVVNPYEWMEMISLQGKTNFFEKRVSEYSRGISRGRGEYGNDASLSETSSFVKAAERDDDEDENIFKMDCNF